MITPKEKQKTEMNPSDIQALFNTLAANGDFDEIAAKFGAESIPYAQHIHSTQLQQRKQQQQEQVQARAINDKPNTLIVKRPSSAVVVPKEKATVTAKQTSIVVTTAKSEEPKPIAQKEKTSAFVKPNAKHVAVAVAAEETATKSGQQQQQQQTWSNNQPLITVSSSQAPSSAGPQQSVAHQRAQQHSGTNQVGNGTAMMPARAGPPQLLADSTGAVSKALVRIPQSMQDIVQQKQQQVEVVNTAMLNNTTSAKNQGQIIVPPMNADENFLSRLSFSLSSSFTIAGLLAQAFTVVEPGQTMTQQQQQQQ